jgi:quinol monooxygenase YgiN
VGYRRWIDSIEFINAFVDEHGAIIQAPFNGSWPLAMLNELTLAEQQTVQGDELAEILVEASQLVATAPGCRIYLISRDPEDESLVVVTEVWDSEQNYTSSLQMTGVRDWPGHAAAGRCAGKGACAPGARRYRR